MIPGEWESRRRSNVVPFAAAALPGKPLPQLATNGDTSRVLRAESVVSQSPAWVRILVGLGVLLAATIVAMWGTALAVR